MDVIKNDSKYNLYGDNLSVNDVKKVRDRLKLTKSYWQEGLNSDHIVLLTNVLTVCSWSVHRQHG